MISCESCQELLPEFSLGELDERDQRKVKFHVQKCRSCALELGELNRVWISLPLALEPIEPPAMVKVQLMERVEKSAKVRKVQRPNRVAQPGQRRNWSRPNSKIIRYMIAAMLLLGLFVVNRVTNPAEETHANVTEASQRIRHLAKSLGRNDQLADPNRSSDFVYVNFSNGQAYDLLPDRLSAYAIWDRVTDRWHVFANNLNLKSSFDGSKTLKVWLSSNDGELLASSKLVIREFGNTSVAMYAPNLRSVSKAMITLESDPNTSTPSSTVIFQARFLATDVLPVELEK